LIKFFLIPVHSAEENEKELNRFINQYKTVSIEKNFVADGANSFWSICLTTVEKSARNESLQGGKKRNDVDYKEILSPDDFAVYAELRSLRKLIAEKDGIPAYAVFTNAQLAKIVTDRISSDAALLTVEGIGQTRVDKYGRQFLTCLEQFRKTMTPSDNDGKI